MTKGISNGYDSSTGEFDRIKEAMIERSIEPKKKKLGEVADKLQVVNNTNGFINTISNGIKQLRNNVENINSPFYHQGFDVTTDEPGMDADDLIKVSVKPGTTAVGSINVKVERLAVLPSIQIRKPSPDTAKEYFQEGEMISDVYKKVNIDIDGFEHEILILPGTTVKDMIKKINDTVPVLHVNLVRVGEDERTIIFQSTDPKAQKINSVKFRKAFPSPYSKPKDTKELKIERKTTQIIINGTKAEFLGKTVTDIIPGVDIELKAANTPGKSQTITFGKGDKERFKEQVQAIASSANVLLENIHKAKTDLEKQAAENNRARNYEAENAIREAEDVVNKLVGGALSSNGALTWTNSDDGVEQVRLDTKKLEAAWKDKDKLQKTLLGSVEQVGLHNNGSSLVSLTPGSSTKPVQVKVSIAVDGGVTAEESSDEGANWAAATYDATKHTIKLRDGTELMWNQNGAANNTRAVSTVQNGELNQVGVSLSKLEQRVKTMEKEQKAKVNELKDQQTIIKQKIEQEQKKIDIKISRIRDIEEQFRWQDMLFQQLFEAMSQA